MKMLAIYMKKLQIITSLLNHARDQAGSAYVKLAECHLKMDSKHEAVIAYAVAAHSYKKQTPKERIHIRDLSKTNSTISMIHII
ncbi:alpha-soluble NSF attachment protein-like isoform X7 [Rutidosis leptorrhynchoides]|uniref:alpha-soluble NSF attachment protein-like isoform X7 n=1 Tax=Rutidosis leptorrhynchoides TaxID=125765 RepID=UPI003A99A940